MPPFSSPNQCILIPFNPQNHIPYLVGTQRHLDYCFHWPCGANFVVQSWSNVGGLEEFGGGGAHPVTVRLLEVGFTLQEHQRCPV
ncbi:hypothetical protein BRADI_2g17868v3 [Brachypodium distachyon]|uniref:Uncharacterized protein n=1 Tax=Brachypodium distachyon TaxID=15368 RepID=A0A2K2D941_BRADI|nr:hypothetical protein BRADI_2g17868v3 [Brachypodium distachyon]